RVVDADDQSVRCRRTGRGASRGAGNAGGRAARPARCDRGPCARARPGTLAGVSARGARSRLGSRFLARGTVHRMSELSHVDETGAVRMVDIGGKEPLRRRAVARAGVKAAVLTVSDGAAAGERDDASGDLLVELLGAEGYEVERRVVPDDRETIADAIVELAEDAALVLTTGGTGLGPRDVTPEASAEVIDRPAPGIAEAIRADSIAKTPHGLL